MMAVETHLKYNEICRLKENDVKDTICKQQSKEARVATLISGKIDFI